MEPRFTILVGGSIVKTKKLRSLSLMSTTKEEKILSSMEGSRTKCTIWTRVMGYHRPVETFNIGKKGEIAERKWFSTEK